MKKTSILSKSKLVAFGVATVEFLSALTTAQTLPETDYATWGIQSSVLAIPEGSIIIDAILTVKGLSPSTAPVEVYLLNNPAPGYVQRPKDNDANSVFAGFGTPLAGAMQDGDWVCGLNQLGNNNLQSWVWDVFPAPFTIPLPKDRLVSYTSALLELTDYSGSGLSFGFGVESAENISLEFTSIELMVTVSSYQLPSADKILIFTYLPEAADSVKVKNPNAIK